MARRHAKARRKPTVKPQGILELTARGYGFVKTAEGEFFIPASKVNGGFPGDLVEVAHLSSSRDTSRASRLSDRKPTARVVKVLMRAQQTLIGRYEVAEPFGVVIPENPAIPYDIFTLRKDAPHVNDGDIVEVEMIEYPSRRSAATGRIVRVVGRDDDPRVEIDVIIAEHDLETQFSSQALQEAKQASNLATKALESGYRDLRSLFTFTIDPHDARDYDDALSLEVCDDGYVLGVHIADVSAYVPYGSALDLAARRRATSVYLVDRVLPMLPEQISNELCSLVPGKPRLSVSVLVTLTPTAEVVSYEIAPAVISSNARLSYDQAQALLDVRKDACATFRSLPAPQGACALEDADIEACQMRIRRLKDISQKLFAQRYRAGCMDFDRVEARVRLDDAGHPQEVTYRRRTPATIAVEESMILANRLVAQWLTDKQAPCVYRVHDEPDGSALAALYEVLQEFKEFSTVDRRLFCAGHPPTLQLVLRRAHHVPQGALIDTLLLRSMKRAIYQPTWSYHYGLALDCYCHFTSPIRRYPDLLVHRMVKEVLLGKSESFEAQKDSLAWMAEHASKMERIAAHAERESQEVKMVEYLQDKVGQHFQAVVCGVSTFGLTVRLENTAQGIVPIEELGGEYFAYDPMRHTLTGQESAVVFRLGQQLKVVLKQALPRRRSLRFSLLSSNVLR